MAEGSGIMKRLILLLWGLLVLPVVAEDGTRVMPARVRAEMEAVAQHHVALGVTAVQRWEEGWLAVGGRLTAQGAREWGYPDAVGARFISATMTLPDGWVAGLLKVEGQPARRYLRGPALLEPGQTVKFRYQADGGTRFTAETPVLADGTLALSLKMTEGQKEVRLEFGPRVVVLPVTRIRDVWNRVDRMEPLPEGTAATASGAAAAAKVDPERRPPPALSE